MKKLLFLFLLFPCLLKAQDYQPAPRLIFDYAHKRIYVNVGVNQLVVLKDSTATMVNNGVVRFSAGTLTLAYGVDYVFTGSTTTVTLPAITAVNVTRSDHITIKNAGSGNITLNSNSGSTIYDTSLVSTITIGPGAAIYLIPDSFQFNKE